MRMPGHCARLLLAALVALALPCMLPATAQEQVAAIAPDAPDAGVEKPRQVRQELSAIEQQLRVTEEQRAAIEAEAERTAADRAALSQRLVESARASNEMTQEMAALEQRLNAMAIREAALKTALTARNREMSDLLAAMQRLGRSPPPALLVQPRDAVGALRSAMMLGTAVPQLRSEAEALDRELSELAELSSAIDTAKRAYADRLDRRRQEDLRLEALIRRRQMAEDLARQEAAALVARQADLARRAESLGALIAALDAQPPVAAQASDLQAASYDVAGLRQGMAKLAASAAFSTLKGVLNPPVAGLVAARFGQADAAGRAAIGMTFSAEPGERVDAPADAEVLYSGPFRSYGQLLILNAGDGYHIVLAGMAEIDVRVGQLVLAGEPVARMGARRLASADATTQMPDNGQALYVEFRKDGQPVDPAPWWAERPSGRTRNDT